MNKENPYSDSIGHVVFDFNGTLFDDARIIHAADNKVAEALGWRTVPFAYSQEHSRREWREYYEHLADRPITTEEAAWINSQWHDFYEELVVDTVLVTDAHLVIDAVREEGWTTSICSMHPHNLLMEKAQRLDLVSRMERIDGYYERDTGAASKTEHLAWHLQQLAEKIGPLPPAERIWMIGDNLDDGVAALGVGVQPLLVSSGEHSTVRLKTLGVPVVETLQECVDFIVQERVKNL